MLYIYIASLVLRNCSISVSCRLWFLRLLASIYLSESTEPGGKGVWRSKTDGVNLQVLWKYADILNLKQAYTNNIHAMANAYGIEAACKAIIKVRKLISC